MEGRGAERCPSARWWAASGRGPVWRSGKGVEEYRYTWSRSRRNTYLPTYLVYIPSARCTRLIRSSLSSTSCRLSSSLRPTLSHSLSLARSLSLSFSVYPLSSSACRSPGKVYRCKSSMMHAIERTAATVRHCATSVLPCLANVRRRCRRRSDRPPLRIYSLYPPANISSTRSTRNNIITPITAGREGEISTWPLSIPFPAFQSGYPINPRGFSSLSSHPVSRSEQFSTTGNLTGVQRRVRV